MKFELKRVEELDEDVRWEIWIDEECHKSYKKSSFKDPEAAVRLQYDLMVKRARDGYPKTEIIKTDDIDENKNKVTPKTKK